MWVLPCSGVVTSATAVLVLQGVPPAPDDGVEGVGDELGADIGLAEPMCDGFTKYKWRHASGHGDAHGNKEYAWATTTTTTDLETGKSFKTICSCLNECRFYSFSMIHFSRLIFLLLWICSLKLSFLNFLQFSLIHCSTHWKPLCLSVPFPQYI